MATSQNFFYPPGGSNVINVGSVDQGSPNTVANSWPIKITDGTDVALVTASGELNVTAAALPLPSGAATSANQTTEIASLSSIDTKLSSQATATKQDTGNTSLSSIDTKLSSQATATKQDTGNTSLSSIDTKLSSQATATKQDTGNTSIASIDTKLVSDTASVSGAFSGTTPVNLTVSGLSSVIIQLTPGALGDPLPNTVQFLASNDGSTFYAVYANDLNLADGQLYTLANFAGFYSIPVGGFQTIRLIGGTGTSYAVRGAKGTNSLFASQAVQFVSITGTAPLPTGAATAANQVNTAGSIVNTALSATTATAVTAPANARGFILEAPSTNTHSIRWCAGGTASTTVGMLAEPGRDSGYIPLGANLSVCAITSGTNAFSIQWVLSA